MFTFLKMDSFLKAIFIEWPKFCNYKRKWPKLHGSIQNFKLHCCVMGFVFRTLMSETILPTCLVLSTSKNSVF